MAYQLNIREEEVKNRLRKDYFNAFNAEEVLGDIDFAVAVPNPDSTDATYTALITALRQKQKLLASKIATKVYAYGFLKK